MDESTSLMGMGTNDNNQLNAGPDTPEGPTDSHVLSQIDQDEKGLSQMASETTEITNIGWDESPNLIEEPLVAGLSNEDLWMLIRRFDKVSSSLHLVSMRIWGLTETCVSASLQS